MDMVPFVRLRLRVLPCRFLIKNELLFVAEREIEVHIWKVVMIISFSIVRVV